jgi:hypothetical protein
MWVNNMDDILAIIIFFVACCITGLFIRSMIKAHNAKVEAELKRQQAIAEARATDTREREKLRRQADEARKSLAQAHLEETFSVPRKKRTFVKREESTVPPRGKETTVTYAPSPTQSVQSSRSLLDDAADIAMIANTIHHWNDNSRSEPVREERSVGVSKSESSWGFDDSDSRKSISSSMDTSSSYSSSSSDSSSSWSSSDSSSSVSSDW